jgi:DNA repair exonuclease SbcCD nuclease subunit
MKHAVFTDLHVGLNINQEVWEKLPIKAVEFLTTEARRRNLKSIIFAGDFYHDKKELSIKAIDSARIICEMLDEFQTYIICGNHDAYFRNTNELNSLQTIDKFKNIHIINSPTIIYDKIGLCPWSTDYRELKCPILIGHFDIKDFKMNDNTTSFKGEEISSFKDFEIVISGHYHTYSKKGNIVYIGNMYGHNFNDVNASRGFHIFDDETLELEFVEFKDAPKFIHVFDMDLNEEQIKGNIIKIYFTKEYSEMDILDFLTRVNSLNPLQVDVNYSRIEMEDVKMDIPEEIFSTLDEKQLFLTYLDKISIPDHLKLPMCKKILEDLFKNQ